MTPEIGLFALVLALCAALFQSVFPLWGAARGDTGLMAAGRTAAFAQLALVALAFAVLAWAHTTSDFSVRNVVENSHSAKPLIYKFSSTWGNHEGSMVLWALILAAFGGLLAGRADVEGNLQARTLAVQGMVSAAFLLFILLTSNPFARVLPPPADGMDLNPLLQDPGLALHPPFLYLGYVGLSIVFAFAVAGLIEGRIDEAWARTVRPWALAAWSFLTVGIALGSWWAYYELGWGGFWAWDPVENASFMPWLAATALIHSLRATEVRGAFRAWTALLAILAFSLSLVGTFIVRSGVITSVHAFAVDPQRGVFILAILAAAVGGALALFAWRGPALGAGGNYAAVSREGGLLVNNSLLAAACAVVFIGTFYPLFIEVVSQDRISVGPPYFNAAFLPFAALVFAIIAPAGALAWRKGDLGGALRRLWPAGLAALAAAAIAAWLAWPKGLAAIAATGLVFWAGAGALTDFFRRIRIGETGAVSRAAALPRNYVAMTIAHIGLAIAGFGVIGAGAWKSEAIAWVREGETIAVGGYQARLLRVEETEGPNYVALVADFAVEREGRGAGTLAAERRFYPVRGMETTEAGIRTSLAGDFYITIGGHNPDFGWAVRAWRYPFAVWMWIGAGLMALGGAAGIGWARASRRARSPARAEMQAAE